MKITIHVLLMQFYNSCVEFTIVYILNECLIHIKPLPFNFFHSSFCAVKHGLQVTDLGLILYDNRVTITRTNTCRQHTSKAVTCAMCMHGCITECYVIFTDYLTIQGHRLLEVRTLTIIQRWHIKIHNCCMLVNTTRSLLQD